MIVVYGWDDYYPCSADGNVIGIVNNNEEADELIRLSKDDWRRDNYEKQSLDDFIRIGEQKYSELQQG